MEHTGFEPVTSTLPVWRAPSCANAPENGSKEARTPDLSRVRRTLIPAELCFHIIDAGDRRLFTQHLLYIIT